MSLAPGIYKATVRGVPDQIVMVGDDEHGRTMTNLGRLSHLHTLMHITDARPLIVLDPESDQVRDFLRNYGVGSAGSYVLERLATQIEAQFQPPRIEEPSLVGSLVVASLVSEVDGSERLWTRFRAAGPHCWIDQSARIRSWSDLADPELYGATQ